MVSPGKLPQSSVIKQNSPYQAMTEFIRDNISNSYEQRSRTELRYTTSGLN